MMEKYGKVVSPLFISVASHPAARVSTPQRNHHEVPAPTQGDAPKSLVLLKSIQLGRGKKADVILLGNKHGCNYYIRQNVCRSIDVLYYIIIYYIILYYIMRMGSTPMCLNVTLEYSDLYVLEVLQQRAGVNAPFW